MPVSSYFPPEIYPRFSGSSRSRMDCTHSNDAPPLQRIQLSLEKQLNIVILQLLRGIAKAFFLRYTRTTEPRPISLPWWQEQQQASIWDSGKDPQHGVITWLFNIHLFCQCLRAAKPKYFQVWHLFYHSIPNYSVAQFLPAYTLYTLFKTLRWLSFGVKQILAAFLSLREQFCSTVSRSLSFKVTLPQKNQGNFTTTDSVTVDLRKNRI